MKTKLALVIVLALVLASCGAMTQGLKSPANMSPKELSTWANGIYNAQYDNYKELAQNPDVLLSEDEKKMLRKKKAAMVELWPYLKLYTTYVDTGAIPTAALQAKVISLIDELVLATLE